MPAVAPFDLGQVLAVRPSLRAERVASAVFLIGERERVVLSGTATVEVAMLVDGRRSVHDILVAARARVSEPEVLYVLRQLVDRGYLVPAAPALASSRPAAALAFWYGAGLDGAAVAQALDDARVAVQTLGGSAIAMTEVVTEAMTGALEAVGVRVDRNARTQVVVTDDYLHPALASINRLARRDGAPWFLLKPTGVQPLIGPGFEPAAGPCWDCLAFWIRQNRPVEELVRRHRAHEDRPEPQTARGGLTTAATLTSVRTACGFGALAIARMLAGGGRHHHALGARVIALDLATLQTTAHAVVRRPQCATCGDPARMTAVGERPIELAAIAKAHYEDGGYRRQPPRRTYERYHHLVSPITGAVTHLVPMPDRDSELRAVYASGYLVSPRTAVPHNNLFDKACAGKGRSADQARVSALCEALERFSGVYQGDEARLRASCGELGAAAFAPGDLLNFSDTQYRERDRRNARDLDRRRWIPAPLPAGTAIDWTPGWSLRTHDRRYVPLAYCYAEAPADAGTAYCTTCSNGVAAGTCLEEAILQALLELIERDAAAIWWYSRARRPAIDLESFADPYFDALQADYRHRGWTLWVLDLTHDLGIATCVALAHEPGQDRFAIGFGCHLEPRLAVQRALTELNQLFDPSGPRRTPWDRELLDRDYLFPQPDRPLVTAASLPRITGADLRADIEHCTTRLERAGLELVVVDKTRPDIGLHVAQVIVPGLRHFWPRFGPGRLYQVPRTLGWLDKALDESELNPVALFV